jgi:hypothetical protein
MESDSSSRKRAVVIGYLIAAFIGVVALQWAITTVETIRAVDRELEISET